MNIKNNLILFATYWNEIDWIEASLKQIDKIDPIEIIICDGCFDESYPLHSTDGTKEIIEQYVSERDNAKLTSPVRVSRFQVLLRLLKGHKYLSWYRSFWPSRVKMTLSKLKLSKYRINQGLTFQSMINMSKEWKPGKWFMTYDSDQFYDDDTIYEIQKLVNESSNIGLLTASERTFFYDFETFTPNYEKRNYNNMPHKIFDNTTIYPTRALMVEDFLSTDFYKHRVFKKNIGFYNHYKFVDRDRFNETYEVGDREMPEYEKYARKSYSESHPQIIENYYQNKLQD